jgi:hypothetical protein
LARMSSVEMAWQDFLSCSRAADWSMAREVSLA